MSDCLTCCYSSLGGHGNFGSHPCFSDNTRKPQFIRPWVETPQPDLFQRLEHFILCLLPGELIRLSLPSAIRQEDTPHGACEGAGRNNYPLTRECIYFSPNFALLLAESAPCCPEMSACSSFFPNHPFLNTWVSPVQLCGAVHLLLFTKGT